MNIISNFKDLTKAAKKITLVTQKPLKIAILGNHATQFFCVALESQLKLAQILPEIYEAEYDQIDINIIDPTSDLYTFQPDVIVLFESTLTLKKEFYSLTSVEERSAFADHKTRSITQRVDTLRNNGLNSKIIHFSYELMDDEVFGNYFANLSQSFYHQLFQLNAQLIQLAGQLPGLYIFEINKYIHQINPFRDWALYVNADLHYTLDSFALFGYHLSSFISAMSGRFKKCLILDLDNTTWGGIIGDDGLENIQIGSLGIGKAFTGLQKWAKELKNRGVILAVCSKNNEEIAAEPFEKHPDMVLRMEDISVFVANWKNKADNIRYIQEILNIGFDSMVFLDDNPAEREIVRQGLPEVTVPELPTDPANYLPYLQSLNLFDTASHSANDKDRTLQYQQEAKRKQLITSVTNMDEYLKSLEMEGSIERFNLSDAPRIAQLTQRSNQFNLRTIRYSLDDIQNMIDSTDFLTYSVKLKDKFGHYGLISVVILKKVSEKEYFIDTWIMSCRVLKRGVENFVFNALIEDAQQLGIQNFRGEYLPTPKNKLVVDLLDKLGLKKINDTEYKINVSELKKSDTFITILAQSNGVSI